MQTTPQAHTQADSLSGKVAVITGANRGIGLAIATLFARHGARCVMAVRDRASGNDAVQRLKAQDLDVELGIADVTDLGALEQLASRLAQRYAAIDVLVNNAGVLLPADRVMSPRAIDLAVVQRTLDVNLFGVMRVCKAFVPLMRRGARIINVSSTMGQLTGGSDGHAPAYCLSKSALNAYTQALSADLRNDGIMVDCFHPGWAKTSMGGPNATVDPLESAQTALFLATRPPSDETGLFWRGQQQLQW
jgi:NAD(P)-dependent dehydrogenase (short-subunit alcohol dehydrogenase family)